MTEDTIRSYDKSRIDLVTSKYNTKFVCIHEFNTLCITANIETLKYAVIQFNLTKEDGTHECWQKAAMHGRLSILKWLVATFDIKLRYDNLNTCHTYKCSPEITNWLLTHADYDHRDILNRISKPGFRDNFVMYWNVVNYRKNPTYYVGSYVNASHIDVIKSAMK